MTTKQKIIKSIYPFFSRVYSWLGKNNTKLNSSIMANTSVYNLEATRNNGEKIPMEIFKNKKLLIVNVASACGYTPQYNGLQELYDNYKDQVEIIAFPSNEFGEQEKGSDEEIASFCKINFGVSFPLMQKTIVRKKAGQHPVYEWLTQKDKNGWNDHAPTWNFCKYIVDENGNLTHFFEASTEPSAKEMLDALGI